MSRSSDDDAEVRADELEPLMVRVVSKHPIKLLYILGLLIWFFFRGFNVPDEIELYNHALDKIKDLGVDDAKAIYLMSQNDFNYARGWFYSCSDTCKSKKQTMEEKKKKYDSLLHREAAILTSAKGHIGLFSMTCVEETKEIFWANLHGMYSSLHFFFHHEIYFSMVNIETCGEDSLEHFFRLISFALINVMIIGVNVIIAAFVLVSTFIWNVVTFAWELGTIVRTYKATFLDGLLFYILASITAISVIVSFILGIFTILYAGFFLCKILEEGKRRGEVKFVP